MCLIWTRFRPYAALVLAAVAAAACTRAPVAKVTRADGAAMMGEIVGSRPDVVMLRLRAGDEVTISRATIQSIDVPTVDEWARYSAGHEGPERDARADARDGSERNRDVGPDAGAGQGDANPEAEGRRAASDGSKVPGPNAPGSNAGDSNAGGTSAGGPGGPGRSGGSTGPGGSIGPRGSRGTGGSGVPGGPGAPGGPGGTGGSRASSGTGSTAYEGAASGGGFVVRDAVIPEDTTLTVALDAAVASDRTTVKTPIEATLTAPINVPAGVALPIGTRLRGAVTEAVPGSLARGRGRLTLHFHSLVIAGETIPIDTDALPFRAPGLTRNDAKKVGIGAAIGAGIGKVVTKTKRGLGIGGAAGAAATAAVVGRKDVELGRGVVLRVILNEPVALGAARDR